MSLTEHPSSNNSTQAANFVGNPARIFWLSILILVVVGGALFYLEFRTDDLRTGKSRVNQIESLNARIQPVARFALTEAEVDQVLKTGEQVYESTCASCHSSGLAGAPTFKDQAAWAPYIETGYEAMLEVALNGKGAMPAKGGNSALDDIEVARAMVYMANAAGANFDEPVTADDQAATPTDMQDGSEPAPAADDSAAGGIDIVAATDEQLSTGKALYDASCFACHGSGVAGAPKIGDAGDWGPYMETGLDTMLQIAISGKGAMPPRGTAMNASDDELQAAILYMIEDAR